MQTPTEQLGPNAPRDQTVPDNENEDEDSQPEDDDDILEEARTRFEDSSSRDKTNRDAAKEDTEFVYVAGKQWDTKVKERWGDDPTLEFPQLKQFVNQVVNDARQNRAACHVHAASGRASQNVALILEGMLREIQYKSQSDAVYDTAYQAAVVGGRGFWRVCSEYENSRSFDQVVRLKSIDDPLTVYMDVDYQEPDASDQNYTFVCEKVKRDDFEKRWPTAEAVSWSPSETTSRWYDGKDEIIVADYYRRVQQNRTLLMMSDGSSGFLEDMPAGTALPPGVRVLAQRETKDIKVEWYKLAGGEQILEKYDCPGEIIPIICCIGDTIIVDGKRVFQGLIRQARDAQRMYNYEKSMKAILLSLAPQIPWTAPAEAIAGYEDIWKASNKIRTAVLPYKQFDAKGRPLNAPQRVAYAPVATGYAEAAQSDKDDIKAVLGMYENTLGQRGTEVSGRAILAREKQGDNATFHFSDNLSRAIQLTGRIIVDWIPYYYDTQRIVSTIEADDTRKMVTINELAYEPQQDGSLQAITQNNVTTGKYAVVIDTGPSYATAREQSRESILALVQSYPPIMQFAGDIVVGTLDFPDADELAERFKLMLPPQIQQHLQPRNQQTPDPQALMQQLQDAQAQMQQMQQQLQQMQADQAGTIAKAQIDASKAIKIGYVNANKDIIIANINRDARLRTQEMIAGTALVTKGIDLAMMPMPDQLPDDVLFDPSGGELNAAQGQDQAGAPPGAGPSPSGPSPLPRGASPVAPQQGPQGPPPGGAQGPPGPPQ